MVLRFFLLAAIFLFVSCTSAERDNPDDPHSINYRAVVLPSSNTSAVPSSSSVAAVPSSSSVPGSNSAEASSSSEAVSSSSNFVCTEGGARNNDTHYCFFDNTLKEYGL